MCRIFLYPLYVILQSNGPWGVRGQTDVLECPATLKSPQGSLDSIQTYTPHYETHQLQGFLGDGWETDIKQGKWNGPTQQTEEIEFSNSASQFKASKPDSDR